MSKFFGYFILVSSLAIYIASSSTRTTSKWVASRIESNNPLFRTDKYRFGDLFGMSYLPQWHKLEDKNVIILLTRNSSTPKINLYAVCDSYVWSFFTNKKDYYGCDSFKYATSNDRSKLEVDLDPTKKNVFFLEFAERNVRSVLNDTAYANNLFIKAAPTNNNFANTNNSVVTQPEPKIPINDYIFNKKINTNLELNIWDFSVFTPLKEFKAYINYKLFNSVDEKVVVSSNKKYLFFKPTVDSADFQSSFSNLTDTEVESIVNKLNLIYDKAKNIGFSDVYLSIIPNPVTIIDPNINELKYNNLIPRIQNSPLLKMPFVDIYTDFKNTNVPIYKTSDTHWNKNGANMWLNKFNHMLAQQPPNK